MIGNLPNWAGTIPQWFLFAGVLVTLIKLYPALQKQSLDSSAEQVKLYAETCVSLRKEVTALTEAVHNCERECAAQTKSLMDEIHGQRRQHMQEQISLISAIMQSVDSPQLKSLLRTLESVQVALKVENVLQSRTGTVIQNEDEG